MYILCEWLAGLFYLYQKIGLAAAEKVELSKTKRLVLISAWAIYILGLPLWLVVFYHNDNFIAGAIEFSGLPAMTLGLVNAIKKQDKKAPRWLLTLSFIFMVVGSLLSFHVLGTLTSVKQLLEFTLSVTFLVGTFRLSLKPNRRDGYLWYIVMHSSCAALMYIQHSPHLFWMQIVSIIFIVYAYFKSRKAV